VYVILFLTGFGLFVVIDVFANIDDFTEGRDDMLGLVAAMAGFYGYQSSLFFDLIGSILAVVATMAVFALLQKHSEIHPILAAGIPTWRLILPILVGTVLVTGAIVLNKELVLPRIYHMLQAPRGVK